MIEGSTTKVLLETMSGKGSEIGKTFEELKQEEQKNWENLSLEEHMEVYEKQGISRKEAMKLVAKDRGISKRDVYQALLS